MLYFIYAVIPFILFLLFHYIYIKFGVFITRLYEYRMSGKIAFWFLYGGFGIILVYTDYIPNAYSEFSKPEKHYVNYSETNTSAYQKVHLSGNISPGAKVIFSAELRTEEPRCIKHPRAKYASVTAIYREIISGQYNIDIFKDYIDKQNNCKYKLDTLSVHLYQKDLAIEEVNDEILDQAFRMGEVSFPNSNAPIKIVIKCKDERVWDTDNQHFINYTACVTRRYKDSSSLDQSMKLDVNITGDILGSSSEKRKKRWSIRDVLDKFQIFEYRIL